jgi:phosphate-selective porin OprO/OprP
VTKIVVALAALAGLSTAAPGLSQELDGTAVSEPEISAPNDVTRARTNETPKADADARQPVGFVWKQHPSFRYGTVFRIDFEAKLQEDLQSSYESADVRAGLDPFELHRNRVGIQGRLFEHVEFEIERELTVNDLTPAESAAGMTAQSPWKDVYVDVDYLKRVQIRAGRFKIPFGLDQLTGPTHNDFVNRSLGGEYLAPARDTGVIVHGRFFQRGLNYWTGVFTHDGDNARSKKIQGGNQTYAVRVTGTPLRRVDGWRLDRLEVGTALTVSALSDDSFRANGLRGRTVVTEDTFFEPVYVKGRRWRWEGDLDWAAGPSSLRFEYTHVTDDRLDQGFLNEDLPAVRYRAWYGSGTYLLTGEKKSRPVKPRRDFLRGGIGALELAARYERLWCDSVGGDDVPFRNPRAETILPSGDRVLTIGVNWIVNRWMTLQINAIREHVEDPMRSPIADGSPFWSRVLRLQFVL